MRVGQIITLGAASLFCLAACAKQPDTETAGSTQAIFAGGVVELSNDQGRCKLSGANTSSVVLDMQWPCQFSINRQKQPRVEMYKDIPVLMVERSVPLPLPSQDCRTDRQAVRWYKGRLEAARAQHIAMCGPALWDQNAFFASFKW
jgi:hypothetical protein